MHGMVQHASSPTHIKGHVLGGAITKSLGSLFFGEPLVTGPELGNKHGHIGCDHWAVTFWINCEKPHKVRRLVTFRQFRNINVEGFKQSVRDCDDLSKNNWHIEQLIEAYEYSLTQSCILDEHAPLCHKICYFGLIHGQLGMEST